MTKYKVIKKVNQKIADYYEGLTREIFETLYQYENIGKSFEVILNIKTLKYHIEVKDELKSIIKNPYCITIYEDKIEDRGELEIECMCYLTTSDEEDYLKEIGALDEYIKATEEDEELKNELFGEILCQIGALDKFYDALFEDCYQCYEFKGMAINEDDLKHLSDEELEQIKY